MKQHAIGIMSGTSLDGIDIALVAILENNGMEQVELIAGETYPYPPQLIPRIRSCMNPNECTAALMSSVHFELGTVYASVVTTFLQEHQIHKDDIELIACHGQTIYHIDNEPGYTNSSLQLGDGSVLSTLTGIPVVSNFRNADIAVGGTGAPLVPYADYLLFKQFHKSIVLHNIGGISNVTVLQKDGTIDDMIAFDTGPGNVLINEAMEQLYHKPYDHNGSIAESGELIPNLVEDILSNAYFKLEPPKSTGRELFGKEYTSSLILKYHQHPKQDIIASMTYATAKTMIDAYQKFILPQYDVTEIVVSGGGLYNTTLLAYLQAELPTVTLRTSSDYGVDPDYKEAIAFAILGHETMHQRPSNVPSATGASRAVVLGQISVPMKEEIR